MEPSVSSATVVFQKPREARYIQAGTELVRRHRRRVCCSPRGPAAQTNQGTDGLGMLAKSGRKNFRRRGKAAHRLSCSRIGMKRRRPMPRSIPTSHPLPRQRRFEQAACPSWGGNSSMFRCSGKVGSGAGKINAAENGDHQGAATRGLQAPGRAPGCVLLCRGGRGRQDFGDALHLAMSAGMSASQASTRQ